MPRIGKSTKKYKKNYSLDEKKKRHKNKVLKDKKNRTRGRRRKQPTIRKKKIPNKQIHRTKKNKGGVLSPPTLGKLFVDLDKIKDTDKYDAFVKEVLEDHIGNKFKQQELFKALNVAKKQFKDSSKYNAFVKNIFSRRILEKDADKVDVWKKNKQIQDLTKRLLSEHLELTKTRNILSEAPISINKESQQDPFGSNSELSFGPSSSSSSSSSSRGKKNN
jgi:hypothetical protein